MEESLRQGFAPTFGDESSIPGEVNRDPLVDRLAVRCVADDDASSATFTGRPIAGFDQRTYGGHLLAQATLAATATVQFPRTVTSLHAYFLRMGGKDIDLTYLVNRVRDGRTLSVRSVAISQGDRELAVAQMMFGSQSAHDDGQVYRFEAPHVPGPAELPSLDQRRLLRLPDDGIKLPIRSDWRSASRPLDIRYVDDAMLPKQSGAQRCFWFRTEDIARDAGQNVHRAIMVFASDRSLLPVIAKARGELDTAVRHTTASIDHTLWFHDDVAAGRWYLYAQDSPFSNATNGLARGTIFDEHRRAVASVAQQGLIRL